MKLPNEVLSGIIKQFILLHPFEDLDSEWEENIRLLLRLREVNRFFNEETVKAMLAFADPFFIGSLFNPKGERSIMAFVHRNIFNEIVSGMYWEWRVLMGSIIEEMVRLGGGGIDGEGGRDEVVHIICLLFMDLKFDTRHFNWRFDHSGEGEGKRKKKEMDLKMSCFIIAMVTEGYEDIFQTLEKREDIELDFETTFFGTPLLTATILGRLDLIAHLLGKGADPDVDCHEHSAREAAAQLGNLGAIRLFYDPRFTSGRSERDCEDDHAIARHAAGYGASNLDIVSFLLDRHVDCCRLDADEYLMHQACEMGDLALVERFVDGNVCLWELSGNEAEHWETPIVAAARCGHLEVVEYLLDLGCEVDTEGGNVFAQAAWGNHFDIVFMMLERGFREGNEDGEEDEEDEEEDDEDALQVISFEYAYEGAASNGNLEAAQKIWDKYDTHPPRESDWCSTAFQSAICKGHPNMIEWFVEKIGNDVDVFPFRWEGAELVPLVEAVRSGRPESVDCLLRLGAKSIDIEEPGMKERLEFEKMTRGKKEALKVLSDWKGIVDVKRILGS